MLVSLCSAKSALAGIWIDTDLPALKLRNTNPPIVDILETNLLTTLAVDKAFVSMITRTISRGLLTIAFSRADDILLRRVAEGEAFKDCAKTLCPPVGRPVIDKENTRIAPAIRVTTLLVVFFALKVEPVRGRISVRRNPSVRGALTFFVTVFIVLFLRILNPARQSIVNKRAGELESPPTKTKLLCCEYLQHPGLKLLL